jgi:CelD/BcsL family acetyltransferase involved in cellulose biosynthesis
VAEELFCALDRYDDWHTIDLGSLPNWSPYLEAFVSAAEKRGWGTTTEQEDVAPGVELPPSWDEYLAGLRKKDRHELRRKMRRLEAAGELEQRVFSTASDIDANFIEFVRLHKLSTPEKNEFLTPERESFFRTVTRYLAREGRVRMYFTSLSGVTVATSLCHEVEGRRFVYNSGYDPEYSRLAVGLLNHALFIKSSIAEGISYADFMRGDERYKYHLGARDRIISRLVIQRRQESGLLRE